MKQRNIDKETAYFFPHKFKTGITLLEEIDVPTIVLTDQSYMDMFYITSQCGNDEISWLGSVDKLNNTYIINNIYLLEQKVTSTSTEISEVSLVKLVTDLLKKGMMKEVNSLRFWGHLHPGNSTSPSGTDNAQMGIFRKNCNDFFIRGILGRNGRMEFSVFDYVKGLVFDDVEWSTQKISDVTRKNEIKKAIEEKVKKEVFIPFQPPHYLSNFSSDKNDPFEIASFDNNFHGKYGNFHM